MPESETPAIGIPVAGVITKSMILADYAALAKIDVTALSLVRFHFDEGNIDI